VNTATTGVAGFSSAARAAEPGNQGMSATNIKHIALRIELPPKENWITKGIRPTTGDLSPNFLADTLYPARLPIARAYSRLAIADMASASGIASISTLIT
jgi:hypothetical protein